MTRTAALLVICLSAALSIAADRPEPVIEGDRALLDQILESQRKNLKSCARGQMQVAGDVLFGTQRSTSVVDVVWDEQGSYLNYQRSSVDGNRTETTAAEVLQVGDKRIFYTPVAKLVQIAPPNIFSLHTEVKVLPDQWFKLDDSITFLNLLDPKTCWPAVTRYEILKEGTDTVRVNQHFFDGSVFTFATSVRRDNNVYAYEFQREIGFLFRGEIQWEQHSTGQWYVKSLKRERCLTGGPQGVDSIVSLKVTKFNPAPEIPKNRFSIESLRLPPGTTIHEHGVDGAVKAKSTVEKPTPGG